MQQQERVLSAIKDNGTGVRGKMSEYRGDYKDITVIGWK